MRCAGCGKDVKKKKHKTFMGRCPHCGHQFAITNPRDSGVSDYRIRKATDRVSKDQTLFHLPAQTHYEVLRSLEPPSSSRARDALISLGALMAAGALWNWDWPTLAVILALIGLLVGLGVFIGGGSKKTSTAKVAGLVREFEKVNPTANQVPTSEALISRFSDSTQSLKLPADRALICEDRRVVDFYLANEFHLQHACPVIGPDGYPHEVFPNLIEQLSTSQQARVFVLHNLTPAGLSFLKAVRGSKRWFGGRENVSVIDLGLSPVHLPMVKNSLRPLGEIRGNHTTNQVPGLPPGMGAEVSAFRPELLLSMTALGLHEGAALRFSDQQAAQDRGHSRSE